MGVTGKTKPLLALCLVILVVFTAGCTDGNGSKPIVADVINIPENTYIVHNMEPYAGGTTTIEFFVVNDGRDKLDSVEIKFYELGGFTVIDLKCWAPADIRINSEKTDASCVFDDMISSDKRKVVLTLQAPSTEKIKSDTSIPVKYYVKYDFIGHRQAILPLVDDVTMTQPPKPYEPSSPSDGPVVLEFEPPKAGQVKQGSQTVTLSWAKKDVPFEMKMNFKIAGSSNLGVVQPVNISAGDVSIKLIGLSIATVAGKEVACDFAGSDTVTSKEEVQVPGTLSCNFVSSKTDFVGYYNTQLEAAFKYTYEIRREETFTVKSSK